ncbi:Sterol regulatory element-binding protein 2 [Coemansia spiralis]|uniref:Sterol regulatory element-binding protein 2 n=1 Tax=Coemansia spiralis TaxID=417178 RepID=A0A9W8GBF5_9FUNG|nr:Sterol regulatory element-binding protein 2 [Coemansia spiralis]
MPNSSSSRQRRRRLSSSTEALSDASKVAATASAEMHSPKHATHPSPVANSDYTKHQLVISDHRQQQKQQRKTQIALLGDHNPTINTTAAAAAAMHVFDKERHARHHPRQQPLLRSQAHPCTHHASDGPSSNRPAFPSSSSSSHLPSFSQTSTRPNPHSISPPYHSSSVHLSTQQISHSASVAASSSASQCFSNPEFSYYSASSSCCKHSGISADCTSSPAASVGLHPHTETLQTLQSLPEYHHRHHRQYHTMAYDHPHHHPYSQPPYITIPREYQSSVHADQHSSTPLTAAAAAIDTTMLSSISVVSPGSATPGRVYLPEGRPLTAEEKEMKRKVSHSAIEKRRRERTNSVLHELQGIVPGLSKSGKIQKLEILEAAAEYIRELTAVPKQKDSKQTEPASKTPRKRTYGSGKQRGQGFQYQQEYNGDLATCQPPEILAENTPMETVLEQQHPAIATPMSVSSNASNDDSSDDALVNNLAKPSSAPLASSASPASSADPSSMNLNFLLC